MLQSLKRLSMKRLVVLSGCEMALLSLGKKAAQIVRLSFWVFDSPMIDQGEKRPMQSCLKLCDVESATVDRIEHAELSMSSVLSDSVLAIRAHEVLVES